MARSESSLGSSDSDPHNTEVSIFVEFAVSFEDIIRIFRDNWGNIAFAPDIYSNSLKAKNRTRMRQVKGGNNWGNIDVVIY